MKTTTTTATLARCTAVLGLALCLAQPASALPISDVYIGGNDHGYGDVIGDTGNFQINSMDVQLTGSILSVSISTTFAGKGDNGLFASYTNTPASGGRGIGYGDLFLASQWNPYGSAANGYLEDDASNGTRWSYGFSLDDRWMSEGSSGTGSLYALSGDNSDILMSDAFLSRGTFRNGQEVAVDTSGKKAVGSGTWDIDAASQLVNFRIDLAGTSLLNEPDLALHWGFTCANDVIEASVSIPEPGMMSLLGSAGLMLGLTGLVRTRRS